jgi:hypothetical protein
MSENAIDSENISKQAPDTAKPKGVRKAGKKAKPAKKAARAKRPATKPKTDGTNKKAEVIAMMKRAKGVRRTPSPCRALPSAPVSISLAEHQALVKLVVVVDREE